ncbi:hypothetical protein D3C79_1002000 [compost metagenome]
MVAVFLFLTLRSNSFCACSTCPSFASASLVSLFSATPTGPPITAVPIAPSALEATAPTVSVLEEVNSRS